MSNLDNLIAKIISDSEDKAKEIIKNAENEAKEIIKQSKLEAENEKKLLNNNAQQEAKRVHEQKISDTKLVIRDSILKAKMEIIESVFKKALEEFTNMDLDKYTDFLSKQILKLDVSGEEELIVPKKYKNIDINKINNVLNENNIKGNIKLCSEDNKRIVESGFILVKDDIEKNNTFEALLEYYRDELESEIIQILS